MSEKKQQPAYPLRMPTELRQVLELTAADAKRSLNAEIIARLEESFDPLSQLPLEQESRYAISQIAAKRNHSVHAEVTSRLAATRDIDMAMAQLSNGDLDYRQASRWLLDLWQEVGQLQEEVNMAHNNPTILDGAQIANDVASKIRGPELEMVIAVMALAAAFPAAITEEHRAMLLSATSRIVNCETSSPEKAIDMALKQLLAQITLRERGIS